MLACVHVCTRVCVCLTEKKKSNEKQHMPTNKPLSATERFYSLCLALYKTTQSSPKVYLYYNIATGIHELQLIVAPVGGEQGAACHPGCQGNVCSLSVRGGLHVGVLPLQAGDLQQNPGLLLL